MKNWYNKWAAGIIVIGIGIAGGVFVVTAVHALWYAPEQEALSPTLAYRAPSRTVSPQEAPQRLRIPALNIDAAIQYVGITKKGEMGVPSNYSDVAWYKYGPVPGQVGSAVIDGHVDNGLGLSGVFKRLSNIQIGDDVYVDTKKGSTLHFVVVDIELYPYQQAPTETIFNRSDAARLNLITCEGVWIKGDKTYDQRLVVYTMLVAS